MVADRERGLDKPNGSLWKVVIGTIGGFRNSN
jgi:hypothetical protein